jgi:uncharacterized oxidoreductase
MTSESSVTISADVLRSFASNMFQAANVPADEAHVIATSLVESNLCGHESHGIVRVVEYLDFLERGAVVAGAPLEIINRTASAVSCDAGLGFGQVQMRRLIDILVPMAREQGLACGTVRRCGHVGRLGEWVEMLASRNLAGLMSVNDNGVLTSVAPPGGCEPRISTNPIALAVPTKQKPLVLDISTSTVANGKIRVAQIAGRTVPDGWLLDSDGRPTNDPSARFADPPGTILPMGGYKGFGLGLLLDVLVAGLAGGYCPPAPQDEVECNNVLLLAFDPESFSGLTHFVTQSQSLCDYVRTSKPIGEGTEIRLPNDRTRQTRKDRLVQGVPIDAGTWNQLVERARQLGKEIP